MPRQGRSFDDLRQSFEWSIPERFNIGVDICDRWADIDPQRLAIIDVEFGKGCREYSFSDLKAMSNRLANALAAKGIGRQQGKTGDRVGVLLPQRVETAVAHIALAKLACVSIPLFTLFGPEALEHRLRDSGARAVITDRTGVERLEQLLSRIPALELIVCVDGPTGQAEGLAELCSRQSEVFAPVDTLAEDPAILIYTSGTTGSPKGALHAHRVLLGHLPGVEISHDFLRQDGDRFWTPADWAWIGGLLDVLMPALHHGISVVACRFAKFTTDAALDLIRRYSIRNVFLPPTALKMMKLGTASNGLGLRLRSVASGGEPLGAELIQWGRDALGVTINEFYGQTECNMIVSSCAALEPPVPGSMGRPVPGHEVDVIDAGTGIRLPDETEGTIAVLSPDPVMFLGYWDNPKATADKFIEGPEGRWLLTGDQGVRDAEGRLRFLGRDDDIIGSGGYRIGPAEVEDCLLGHEAVRLAGVVAKPDEIRGAVVAAYIVLRDGFAPSKALADDIAQFVKSRLAAHEYPRVVRFIEHMPMTTTGKIIRGQLRKMAQGEAAAEVATHKKI
ncbi:AMP-binding protein [Mesorhizobium sp.]|uniref:AMP-binding protein n=1 Tax=Mesorhizobium sp. TaxID=1871066 RepID=UPI000FE8592E|nr:AMP-binding protein [Mesorhizobium sp.]RWI16760.1 MAG: AMP-dependent synthetase [Mesorhizobium sp.]RWN08749.1 MAG: AMP-dependent synthetase [Mesorhizobium sp.]RWN16175.1 MAG: AMP-dependent synthetase [Mesorhizobium sp.]TIQ97523.1 MAG: AMP-dependent synthetase [Mesorhizobium sp.]